MNKLLPSHDFGTFLVDHCQRISINEMMKIYKQEMYSLLNKYGLQTYNETITLTTTKNHYKGVRYWFTCPSCKNRKGALFRHPLSKKIGCRSCLALKYAKSRYKGMAEIKV